MTLPRKRVLVVDDLVYIRNDLRHVFATYTDLPGAVFAFEVETAKSIEEAVGLIRKSQNAERFHVLVLDLSLDIDDADDRSGARLAKAMGLLRRLEQEIPVVIVFSGYADLRNGVEMMRYGAWDVIDRLDSPDGRRGYERVLESAVTRLQALDLEAHLNDVALTWLQQHIVELEKQYGGELVAIWHKPVPAVVASGKDAFELESRLAAWHDANPGMTYPFVVAIPARGAARDAPGAAR